MIDVVADVVMIWFMINGMATMDNLVGVYGVVICALDDVVMVHDTANDVVNGTVCCMLGDIASNTVDDGWLHIGTIVVILQRSSWHR